MIWWQNNLYVGTSRDSICVSLYGVWELGVAIGGVAFANTYLPYPPLDPDLYCTPDAADLSTQAEIWRWSPITNIWQRVYQSPATIDNPGPGGGAPPRTGKKLPYEAAFRGFAAYTEADGTQSLYAVSVNMGIIWDSTKIPPPRILRTTNGNDWTPLPQTPGTFLGDLPFNSDHSSYRSPAAYNGKLFVLSGPIFGQGSLIASANPSLGDNSWFLAAPANILFYEIQEFNGWLYLGSFNPGSGYAVYKTRAEGTPPYQLIEVIPGGAYLTNNPSQSVVSMDVHYGRLYVGTASATEIIRINPDDTWDLVIGQPRFDTSRNEWKYPISNLDAGFGHTLNDHAWYMTDPYNYLYVGTYNSSTGSRTDPAVGPLLLHNMGGHLYRTPNSWYFSAVTTNGFSNPADPHGGIFDYGIRTMASTPYGVFLGTTNDYYGLAIFRAVKRSSPLVGSPDRLEIEPAKSGGVLLSWLAGIRAQSYRIWRAEILPIAFRANLNIEGWNGVTGNLIADQYVGPYSVIGTTTALNYIDSTVQPGKRYMYYVTGVYLSYESEQSPLVTYPLLLPSVTFAQLTSYVAQLAQRQRFIASDTQGKTVSSALLAARSAAANCQIATAINLLPSTNLSRTALTPDTDDLEVLLSKLVRRLQLYNLFPQQVQSTEFCTGAGH
jgi:hypothetical protein